MRNPYLDEFRRVHTEPPPVHHGKRFDGSPLPPRFFQRRELAHKYSWAVPNEDAISVLVKHSPVIEIGAGTGYWAWLARGAGASVDAYDAAPPSALANAWHIDAKPWTRVACGLADTLESAGHQTLFLCWPLPAFSNDAITRFRGERVILVAQEDPSELREHWRCMQSVAIPQWEGIADSMTVWERG